MLDFPYLFVSPCTRCLVAHPFYLSDFNPDVALSAKFLIPNIFAWCIGMQVLYSRASCTFLFVSWCKLHNREMGLTELLHLC